MRRHPGKVSICPRSQNLMRGRGRIWSRVVLSVRPRSVPRLHQLTSSRIPSEPRARWHPAHPGGNARRPAPAAPGSSREPGEPRTQKVRAPPGPGAPPGGAGGPALGRPLPGLARGHGSGHCEPALGSCAGAASPPAPARGPPGGNPSPAGEEGSRLPASGTFPLKSGHQGCSRLPGKSCN